LEVCLGRPSASCDRGHRFAVVHLRSPVQPPTHTKAIGIYLLGPDHVLRQREERQDIPAEAVVGSLVVSESTGRSPGSGDVHVQGREARGAVVDAEIGLQQILRRNLRRLSEKSRRLRGETRQPDLRRCERRCQRPDAGCRCRRWGIGRGASACASTARRLARLMSEDAVRWFTAALSDTPLSRSPPVLVRAAVLTLRRIRARAESEPSGDVAANALTTGAIR
jgi:hypothetical protein